MLFTDWCGEHGIVTVWIACRVWSLWLTVTGAATRCMRPMLSVTVEASGVTHANLIMTRVRVMRAVSLTMQAAIPIGLMACAQIVSTCD